MYASGLVPVAVGGVSFWVEVAEGAEVRVAASGERKLDGVAEGEIGDLPASLARKIQPIPRIETIPMTTEIRSARSNEG